MSSIHRHSPPLFHSADFQDDSGKKTISKWRWYSLPGIFLKIAASFGHAKKIQYETRKHKIKTFYVTNKNYRIILQRAEVIPQDLIVPQDLPRVPNQPISTLKSGFPNHQFSCWLSTTLQMANTIPSVFSKNTQDFSHRTWTDNFGVVYRETDEQLEHRKYTAALLNSLFEKSRNQEVIETQEIVNLKAALFQIPGREWRPYLSTPFLDFLCTIYEYAPARRDEWYEFTTAAFDSDAIEDPNPMSVISGQPLVLDHDGTPVFPFHFQATIDEAPAMFVSCLSEQPLNLVFDRDSKCRVRCANEETCDYELAAISVNVDVYGVSHHYAYVLENIDNEKVWVEYNDDTVVQHRDHEAFLEVISQKSSKLIYRKLNQV